MTGSNPTLRLPLQSSDLDGYLPHTYPFRLIDRVTELDLEQQSITALKNVTVNEQFFMGHFKDAPVMPGVLILEAMGQAAGVFGFVKEGLTLKSGATLLYAGADKVKFRQKVLPGDQLVIKAKLVKQRQIFYKFKVTALVDNKTCAQAEINLVRQSFEQMLNQGKEVSL